jgi:hypothetical protein
MPLPTLDGPHALSQRLVEQTIRGKFPGVYALSAKEGGIVNLRRIGRADADLGAALREFIGVYSHFSCVAAADPASAYEMECRLYHAWSPPENLVHPESPGEGNGVCPVCGR